MHTFCKYTYWWSNLSVFIEDTVTTYKRYGKIVDTLSMSFFEL